MTDVSTPTGDAGTPIMLGHKSFHGSGDHGRGPRQRPPEAVDSLAATDIDFHEADSWMLIGTNPIVSKAIGNPAQNPARSLTVAISRGMNLNVIDPRRSQTAARATIHIQPRPGEDMAILTGMINIIIGEKLCD